MAVKQIVTSLAAEDFYKFTMNGFLRGTALQHGQNPSLQRQPHTTHAVPVPWQLTSRYPKFLGDVQVKFAFTNRSAKKRPLAHLVDERELKRQLAMAQELCMTDDEVDFIATSLGTHNASLNGPDHRAFLKRIQLPPITVLRCGDDYHIESVGSWKQVMFWETIVMRIVACLASQTLAKQQYPGGVEEAWRVGDKLLTEKIAFFKRLLGLKFVEFGLRRAADPDWHFRALSRLVAELPKGMLLGTSNTLYAKKLGITPKGTMAHELFMAVAALMHLLWGQDAIRPSQMMVLDLWRRFYGNNLSVALNETFGSAAFFADFGRERAEAWGGIRPDSGDPIEEGEKYIRLLERFAIDPRMKMLFMADGQTPETMAKCLEYFAERILVAFGPGTNITNDLGLLTLSIVMKLVEVFWGANSQGTVKLSNNRRKAQGRSADVQTYLGAFDGQFTSDEECRY